MESVLGLHFSEVASWRTDDLRSKGNTGLLASSEEVAGNPTLVWKAVRLWFVTPRRLQGIRSVWWFKQAGTHPAAGRNTHTTAAEGWNILPKFLSWVEFDGSEQAASLGSTLRIPRVGGTQKASFRVSKTLPFHACFYLVIASLWPPAPSLRHACPGNQST